MGVFLERQRQGEKKSVAAIDVQRAIQLMREFNGFSSVAAMARQGWQCDGMRTERDGVVGSDDALVAQAEAAGKIEAAGQGAEVGGGLGGGAGKMLVVIGTEAGEHACSSVQA